MLAAFLILAAIVSPRINPNVGGTSSIVRTDSLIFLQINDSHYKPLDEFMLLVSKYGREVVWILTAILLFIFGGWAGRKTAVVMAIAMIVLVPIGMISKEAIGRPRPIVPDNDFLTKAD